VKRAWIVGLFLVSLASAAVAQSNPGYLKIRVFGNTDVYLHFEGNALRMAASEDKLAEAQPIQATMQRGVPTFNDVVLPVPQEAIPKDYTGAKVRLAIYERRASGVFRGKQTVLLAIGEVQVTVQDADQVEWGYGFSVYQQLTPTLSERTPTVSADMSNGLTADLSVQPTARKLAMGVKLRSGMTELADIFCAGKPTSVTVQLTDKDGKEVSTKTGKLADFGFA
jgi:hypothetical protein